MPTITSPAEFLADIPVELARAAHRGTSHVPEQRAEQERAGYAADLYGVYTSLERVAEARGRLDLFREEFARFRAGYRERATAALTAKSRCLSTMIAGPSGFNTNRARKASDAADKRAAELGEFRERAIRAIRRAISPEDYPVASGDPDAVERLEERAAKLRDARETMVAANKAIRSAAKRGREAQLEALAALGIPPGRAADLLEPDFAGRIGFADYQLSNSRAELKRLEARIAAVRAAKAAPVEEIADASSGVRVEVDAGANRVRIVFPGKPDAATIAALKAHAFRWAPSVGAWQAYVNHRAVTFAQSLVGAARGVLDEPQHVTSDQLEAVRATLAGDVRPGAAGGES